MTMNCIQSRNPMAGFILSHRPHCSYPHLDGEIEIKVDATHHVSVSTIWCGNVCTACARAVGKRADAKVEERVYVDQGRVGSTP